MVTPTLRCHLLIGPPASGKTTLAAVLAELVGGQVLSTDAIRAELYGDDVIQGAWPDVEAQYHARIRAAVAGGIPIILDATNGQRPWRLAITQALRLPAPVQWIGWWLTTPLEQCLIWNQERDRQVDTPVIERIHGYLPSADYVPDPTFLRKLNADPFQRAEKLAKQARVFLDKQSRTFREEGFAYLAALNPAAITDLTTYCRRVLSEMDRSIKAACNRRQGMKLHRYSRLLDLERLLYLIRLLLEFPGLEFYDHTQDPPVECREDVAQLRQSFRFQRDAPLPEPGEATFAVRAAFALAHRHGPCFGDMNGIEQDLDWLWNQGFTTAFTNLDVVDPGAATAQVRKAMDAGAGFPQAADRPIFQRQLGLLRYLIQNPFDAPDHSNNLDSDLRLEGRRLTRRNSQCLEDKEATDSSPRPRAQRESASLRLYLLKKLRQIYPTGETNQEANKQQLNTLDKDIELLITGYGFRNLLVNGSSNQP
jgi:predicted kinase